MCYLWKDDTGFLGDVVGNGGFGDLQGEPGRHRGTGTRNGGTETTAIARRVFVTGLRRVVGAMLDVLTVRGDRRGAICIAMRRRARLVMRTRAQTEQVSRSEEEEDQRRQSG